MEPLATTKKVLIWLNMHPDRSGTSNNRKKVAQFVLPRLLFILFVCITLSMGSFILKYFRTRLEDCLFAFMASVNCIGTFNTIVIAYFTRHQAPIIFKKLAAIYDASKYFLLMGQIVEKIDFS